MNEILTPAILQKGNPEALVASNHYEPTSSLVTPAQSNVGNPNMLNLPFTYQPRKDSLIPLEIHSTQHGVREVAVRPNFGIEATSNESLSITVPQEVDMLCKKLRQFNGRGLLVGGSVRDNLINSIHAGEYNLKPKDFDIEVYGLEPEMLFSMLAEMFGEENIDTVGKAFGILKVSIEGWSEPLDISIPRRDSKVAEGHTGFTVQGDKTMSVSEAGKRRDLTINSLAYDPLSGVIYDPFNAVEDIKQKRIEVTDNEAFQEDPLRVLRIMQFASRFGFNISENAKQLCTEMVQAGTLDSLPKERVTEELKKLLLKGKTPSVGFNFANEIGFVERYWPELNALINVPQEEEWHPEGDVWTHTLQVTDAASLIANREKLSDDNKLILMLSSLGHDFGKATTTTIIDGKIHAYRHEQEGVKPAKAFLERFQLPQNIIDNVLALIPEHMHPYVFWNEEVNQGKSKNNALNRLAKKLNAGNATLRMLSLLVEADQRGRNGTASTPLRRDEVTNLEEWQSWLHAKIEELHIAEKPPEPLVMGKDLLAALGEKKGGPWVGIILNCVYSDQLDCIFDNRETALQRAVEYYSSIKALVMNEVQTTGKQELLIWTELRYTEDPRTLVQN